MAKSSNIKAGKCVLNAVLNMSEHHTAVTVILRFSAGESVRVRKVEHDIHSEFWASKAPNRGHQCRKIAISLGFCQPPTTTG